MINVLRVSIVIPTHNRKDLLRRCLEAVTRQDYADYEVIVVDDASDDGTAAMIAQTFPQVRYLRQEPKRGPAAARNRGIEAVTGEVVAFTDDDCIVPPDWLTRLIEGFQRQPSVAGVGGYQEPPERLIASNIIARASRVERRRRWGSRAARAEVGAEAPGLATNNVAYRRQVLQVVGGFDERFPVAAGEDADLKLRITQAGYTLLYLPLKVEHHRPYTWRAQWRMAFRRGIGAYYFKAKHHRPPSLGRILLRLGKRLLAFGPLLSQTSPGVAIVITLSGVADALGQGWAARHKQEFWRNP